MAGATTSDQIEVQIRSGPSSKGLKAIACSSQDGHAGLNGRRYRVFEARCVP